jgi:hypothetical protein
MKYGEYKVVMISIAETDKSNQNFPLLLVASFQRNTDKLKAMTNGYMEGIIISDSYNVVRRLGTFVVFPPYAKQQMSR